MKSLTLIDVVEFQNISVRCDTLENSNQASAKFQQLPQRNWHRVELELTKNMWTAEENVMKWAQAHALGKYSLRTIESRLVVYFSHLNDALKFKLSDLQELLTKETLV